MPDLWGRHHLTRGKKFLLNLAARRVSCLGMEESPTLRDVPARLKATDGLL